MEIKELTDKIQSATATLHEEAEKYHEEAKKLGEATGETKATIEKINTRIDELDVKIQRADLVKPGIDPVKSAHTAAFFKWMREGKNGLSPEERKALVSDTTGLYLVPEEIENEIIRAVPQLNIFRKLAPARTTTRDKLRKRTLSEVSMGWGKLETGTDITESTQTPTSGYIYAEDLYGLTKIGEDELADVDANLASIIADSFSVAKSNAEEAAFAIGTGHTYSEPEGIAVDATLQTGIGSGNGVGATGTYGNNWSTDDVVTLDDVLECEYSLPAQYLPGAVWLMNRKTEYAIRILKNATTNEYLWQPSMAAGQPSNIDGFPVYNNNSMKYPADATAGINVIFGNFQLGYRIIDRKGLSLQRLDELYAEAGLVGFKAHFRVGGAIIRHAAFQVICNDV